MYRDNPDKAKHEIQSLISVHPSRKIHQHMHTNIKIVKYTETHTTFILTEYQSDTLEENINLLRFGPFNSFCFPILYLHNVQNDNEGEKHILHTTRNINCAFDHTSYIVKICYQWKFIMQLKTE